jgi:AGZA family xanthine/uracil permease-like MFS transporter
MLERLFRLRASGTTLGREVRGGVVTFLTLSYILFVQPVIMAEAIRKPAQPPTLTEAEQAEIAAKPLESLSGDLRAKADAVREARAAEVRYQADLGKFKEGVFVATCVGSAVACLLMAFLANYPFALAPAMGHNVFFAVTVCGTVAAGGFGLTWQEALAANFISGVVFLMLSFVGLRRAVMEAIPDGLKYAIAVGIGFLIAFVGLQYGGLVVDNPAVLVQRGNLTSPVVLLTLAGLVILMVLLVRRVRGALLLSVLASGLIALGVTQLAQRCGWPRLDYPLASLPSGYELPKFPTATFFQLDFRGLWSKDFVELVIIIFIFLFLDLFDTVGTLIGVGERGGMLVDGRLPRAGRALASDAAGTVVGTVLGTSTITSYIESAAGIAEGARTGLANVVTAMLLLLSLLAKPLISMFGETIVAPITIIVNGSPVSTLGFYHPVLAPVLIVIGGLMMVSVARIRWEDNAEAIPAFLCMVVMLFSLSIADGIAWGFIAYALLKLVSGRGREAGVVVYVISLLALLRYIARPV